MKKKVLYDYDVRDSTIIGSGYFSKVFKLRHGNILKVFSSDFILISKMMGNDIEKKILEAVPLKDSPEILIPTTAFYTKDGNFLGYTMPCAKGVSYNDYEQSFDLSRRQDLFKYAEDHLKIEGVVQRNPNIVFPDLCTCDNIFVDENRDVQFIDYDGLQIGNNFVCGISTSLGYEDQYLSSNKYFSNGRFTKELDKKSLIFLYFLTAFNTDLSKVGEIDPYSGETITIEKVLDALNFDDLDVCHKVWKLFQENEENEYLGDDVFRIAERYSVKIHGDLCDREGHKYFIKTLVRR